MGTRLLAAAVFLFPALLGCVWALAAWGGMRGPAGAVGAAILLLPVLALTYLALRVLRGRTPAWGPTVKLGAAGDCLLLTLAVFLSPAIRGAYRAAGEKRSRQCLSALNAAVMREYRDRGSAPKTLSELVPGRLRVFPRLELPGTGHPLTRELRLGYSEALRDSGKWLYVNEPGDRRFTRVIIDCTHTDSRGLAWSAY